MLMLAFALVPVLLKEAKPLVRAAGRGLRKLGDMVERIADSSQIDHDAETTQAAAVPEEPEAESTEPKKKKKGKPKS